MDSPWVYTAGLVCAVPRAANPQIQREGGKIDATGAATDKSGHARCGTEIRRLLCYRRRAMVECYDH